MMKSLLVLSFLFVYCECRVILVPRNLPSRFFFVLSVPDRDFNPVVFSGATNYRVDDIGTTLSHAEEDYGGALTDEETATLPTSSDNDENFSVLSKETPLFSTSNDDKHVLVPPKEEESFPYFSDDKVLLTPPKEEKSFRNSSDDDHGILVPLKETPIISSSKDDQDFLPPPIEKEEESSEDDQDVSASPTTVLPLFDGSGSGVTKNDDEDHGSGTITTDFEGSGSGDDDSRPSSTDSSDSSGSGDEEPEEGSTTALDDEESENNMSEDFVFDEDQNFGEVELLQGVTMTITEKTEVKREKESVEVPYEVIPSQILAIKRDNLDEDYFLIIDGYANLPPDVGHTSDSIKNKTIFE